MPRKRTLRALTKELIDNPFLPLLFISETIKVAAVSGITQDVLIYGALSVISVAVWVLSDAIDVDIDTEDITG